MPILSNSSKSAQTQWQDWQFQIRINRNNLFSQALIKLSRAVVGECRYVYFKASYYF
jgi:hypothetical protein